MLHPTRLSLCRRAVRPRKLPSLQGCARSVLKGGPVHITMASSLEELSTALRRGAEGGALVVLASSLATGSLSYES